MKSGIYKFDSTENIILVLNNKWKYLIVKHKTELFEKRQYEYSNSDINRLKRNLTRITKYDKI